MAKMMIVDDSLDNREFCGLMARMFDIEVDFAQDVDQALELLKNGSRPNIILLDLMMPGRSPNELVDYVHNDEELQAAKIVLISALREVRQLAKDWEVDGALRKPFDMPKFIDTFRKFSMTTPPTPPPPEASAV